jgi:hypothetical protein
MKRIEKNNVMKRPLYLVQNTLPHARAAEAAHRRMLQIHVEVV